MTLKERVEEIMRSTETPEEAKVTYALTAIQADKRVRLPTEAMEALEYIYERQT